MPKIECDMLELRNSFIAGDFSGPQNKPKRLLFAAHCSTCASCQTAITAKYQANDMLVLWTLDAIAQDMGWEDKGEAVLRTMNISQAPLPH